MASNTCKNSSEKGSIISTYKKVNDKSEEGSTCLMIADYFTKPLQGRMFKLFRDIIMGYRPLDDILREISHF